MWKQLPSVAAAFIVSCIAVILAPELITEAQRLLLITTPSQQLGTKLLKQQLTEGRELGVQTLGWALRQGVQTYRGTKGPHTYLPHPLFFLARNFLAQSLSKTISYPQLLNQQQPKKVKINDCLEFISLLRHCYHNFLANFGNIIRFPISASEMNFHNFWTVGATCFCLCGHIWKILKSLKSQKSWDLVLMCGK